MLPADTIAAIATPRGTGALAIVRLTGPEAVAVADGCLGGRIADAPSHTAHVGVFRAPSGERLDQVVATVFRAPRTATGEDVVEITTHGGDLASGLVLRALLDGGARLADPGEFTQRAFLNGKIDLTQAEAVADLIHAGARQAHRTALAHLRGDYARLIADLRQELLDTAGLVELELDFSDEDVAFADRSQLAGLLSHAESTLAQLLGSYRFGALVRDGVRVAILGRPNAGKSTLLNALVGYDRAIVSPLPGTTRDEVDAEAEIDGLRFRFTDTAGLCDTDDAIEAEGVRRAMARAAEADLVAYAFDLTRGLAADECGVVEGLRAANPQAVLLLVGTKHDLAPNAAVPAPAGSRCFLTAAARPDDPGVAALACAFSEVARADTGDADASRTVTNARHQQHLHGALGAARRARAALDAGSGGDVLALDLRDALHELGAITGAVTTEDVLDGIFSRFCIGK